MSHADDSRDHDHHPAPAQKESSPADGSHSHHEKLPKRKYWENKERIHYHAAELMAYGVGGRKSKRCADVYVPYKECALKLSILDYFFDPKKGECDELYKDYLYCQKHEGSYATNMHVLDSFSNASAKAKSEGLSHTVAANWRDQL